MTLLLAPFDVSTPPLACKYPPDESRRRPSQLPLQRQQRFRIAAGNFVWLWTLLAALVAIAFPALLKHESSPLSRESVHQNGEKPANELTRPMLADAVYRMQASRAFPLEKGLLSPTVLSYHENTFARVELLLGHENVALMDALQPAKLQLEHTVPFNLGNLRAGENPTDLGNKPKGKNADLASRLARVTVYWPDEGDFYTRNRKSSTGVRLKDGHCAVDPKVIPYGSVVNVPGVGRLVAVDTGKAVISRRAARMTGRTREQRSAIVIDIFCSTRTKAKALIKRAKHFAVITWQQPERVAEL
jgi:hypothetical protein